jgi:hypothetical protein
MQVTILWLLSDPASAGQLTTNQFGAELHWETDVVPFQLNPGGKHGLSHDAIEEVVIEAAEQWSDIEGSWLDLTYEGRTDAETHTSGDGVHAIFFVDEWTEDPDLLALTYTYSYEDGAISHFDIAINTDGHAWTTEGSEDSNDLLNALVHEFGHAVGLDHSDDDEASMFSQTSVGEVIKRDLSEDDVLTYASLYDGYYPYPDTGMGCSTAGGSSGGVTGPTGAGGGAYPTFGDSAGCSFVGGGSHALALLAGLLVAFRRRTVGRNEVSP